MKFRKKPVVIEATQWFKNGDHPDDYTGDRHGFHDGELVVITGQHAREHGWEGSVVHYFRRPDVDGERQCEHCRVRMHEHGWIDTLEGGHVVCPGDWVITGVKGERYPCKPDIFTETYEAAESEGASPHPPADARPWLPIETYPLDSTDYVLLASPAHGRVIGAHVTGEVWHLIGVGAVNSESERPTHWLPLPPGPTLKGTE